MNADDLAALADTIGQRLGNEHADRQTICEDVAAKLRQMATSARIADQRAVPVPGVAAVDPVSADRRVDEARAYIESARPRHDVLLPAPVLTSMFYDLRRHALELLRVIVEMHYAEPVLRAWQLAAIRAVLADYNLGTVGGRDSLAKIERIMAGDAGVKLAKVIAGRRAALTPGQVVVLGQALADAIDWRTPGLACLDCDGREAITPCPDHLADLELCESYRALGIALGIEVDR